MYSRSGCGRTDSDRTCGASGWLGTVCSSSSISSPTAIRRFFSTDLQRTGDLLGVGVGHIDIGQHLLDCVAFLEAQRELVAIGCRRLEIGRLLGLLPAGCLPGWLAGLEALEIIGIETPEVGLGDGRRQRIRVGQDHRRFRHLGGG